MQHVIVALGFGNKTEGLGRTNWIGRLGCKWSAPISAFLVPLFSWSRHLLGSLEYKNLVLRLTEGQHGMAICRLTKI
jgi:hypothetical protein